MLRSFWKRDRGHFCHAEKKNQQKKQQLNDFRPFPRVSGRFSTREGWRNASVCIRDIWRRSGAELSFRFRTIRWCRGTSTPRRKRCGAATWTRRAGTRHPPRSRAALARRGRGWAAPATRTWSCAPSAWSASGPRWPTGPGDGGGRRIRFCPGNR